MKTKKTVLLIIGILLNLLLGAWIDRTWFRKPGSVRTQGSVNEQPIPTSLASEQTRNPRPATAAESKQEKKPDSVPPVRSSAEFRAAADQEWKKPGANPKAVLEAREWFEATFPMSGQRGPGRDIKPGVSCCMGCNRGCHSRSQLQGVDSDSCTEMVWYSLPSPPYKRTPTSDMWKASDAVQKLGLNASDLCFMGAASFPALPDTEMGSICPANTGAGWYIKRLYDMGVIGPGKKVDTHPLPMDQYEKVEFAEMLALVIAKRIGIGDLLADGIVRFAEKIGRISDLDSILRLPAHVRQGHFGWTR